MFTWSYTFSDEVVLNLPVHLLEAWCLPVQEKLFAPWFRRATESEELCDNQSTCVAADRRKPKDPRLLLNPTFKWAD